MYDEWLRAVTKIAIELPETERAVWRARRSGLIALAASVLHVIGPVVLSSSILPCAVRMAEFVAATFGILFAVRGLQTLWIPEWALNRLVVRLNPLEAWAGIVGCVVVYALLFLT